MDLIWSTMDNTPMQIALSAATEQYQEGVILGVASDDPAEAFTAGWYAALKYNGPR
jgi:hypothetical protein